MTMPRRLVHVRHGQSEANVVQKNLLPNLDPEVVETIYSRPDWMQRLSPLGIEQAKVTGDWIRQNIGKLATFDVIYVSPFMRTFETASYAAGDEEVHFVPEDRIIERDWGLYGKLSREGQRERYPQTYQHKLENPLYARLDGGESVMDVYARIRDMHATLHREYPDGKVLMFTHGDYMMTERYVNERMLPEEFIEMIRDPRVDLKNGTVIDWTRENPSDPEDVRDKLNWMRIVHPTAVELSPNNGDWVELRHKRRYSVREGLGRLAVSTPLLPDDVLETLRAIEDGKIASDKEKFGL